MGLLYTNYEANPVTNSSVKVDAVSGTMTKTYKESYIVRFRIGSRMEKTYFNEEPYRDDKEVEYWDGYGKKEIVVLQVMLCSDNNYLVEAIDKEDYEKYSK